MCGERVNTHTYSSDYLPPSTYTHCISVMPGGPVLFRVEAKMAATVLTLLVIPNHSKENLTRKLLNTQDEDL